MSARQGEACRERRLTVAWETGIVAKIDNPRSIQTPVVLLDQSGRIAADLPCPVCGHNLRAHLPGSHCPQCETIISLREDLLCRCDPAWLERMARGSSWLAAGIGLETIPALLGITLGFVVSMELIGTSLNAKIDHPFTAAAGGDWPGLALLGLFPPVLGAITLVGLWMITSPDRRWAAGSTAGLRLFICLGYTAQCVLSGVAMARVFTEPRLGMVLHTADSLVAVAVFSAALLYGRQLATRIPDARLARRAIRLMIMLIIVAVIGLVGMWLVAVWAHTVATTPAPPQHVPDESMAGLALLIVALALGGLGSVVSGLMTLFLRIEGLFLVLAFRKAFIAAAQPAMMPVTSR